MKAKYYFQYPEIAREILTRMAKPVKPLDINEITLQLLEQMMIKESMRIQTTIAELKDAGFVKPRGTHAFVINPDRNNEIQRFMKKKIEVNLEAMQ